MEINTVQTASTAALPQGKAAVFAANSPPEAAVVREPVQAATPKPQKVAEESKLSTAEEIKAAAEQVAEFLSSAVSESQRDLQISVDEDVNRTVVRVYHRETGDLIRQFPSEEVLNLAKALAEGQDSISLLGETA